MAMESTIRCSPWQRRTSLRRVFTVLWTCSFLTPKKEMERKRESKKNSTEFIMRTQGHGDQWKIKLFYTHLPWAFTKTERSSSRKPPPSDTQTYTHADRHILRGVTMVKTIFNDILKGQNVPQRLFMVSNLSFFFFPAARSFKFD